MDDIKGALSEGYQVVVAVDSGEIAGNEKVESLEDDFFFGRIPDHSLVVLSRGDEVVCYNPFQGDIPQVIPKVRFIDA